jgi:hypothetical protein
MIPRAEVLTQFVMPAEAGIQGDRRALRPWIPDRRFAPSGMTKSSQVHVRARAYSAPPRRPAIAASRSLSAFSLMKPSASR